MTAPGQTVSNRILIVGAGRGGSAMLELMLDEEMIQVVGIMDISPDANGLKLAQQRGIPTFTSLKTALDACEPCIVFDLTPSIAIEEDLKRYGHTRGIVGGVEALMMWRMVMRMKEMKEDFFYQSRHDPLTSIFNRRCMLEHLWRGIQESARYKTDYSAVLIDADHFKHINDTYGHVAGDKALVSLVIRLQAGIRATDILGRWGGEEFLVLLPHTDEPMAIQAAKNWLSYVSSKPMDLGNGKFQTVTFSAGVASFEMAWLKNGIDAAADAFLGKLDDQLYRAKASGRNKVMDLSSRE